MASLHPRVAPEEHEDHNLCAAERIGHHVQREPTVEVWHCVRVRPGARAACRGDHWNRVLDALETWSEIPVKIQTIMEYDVVKARARVVPFRIERLPLST